MPRPGSSQTFGRFVTWLRQALDDLYDVSALRAHPLAALCAPDEADPLRRSQQLRAFLLDAIRDLQPEAGTPASSPDWRAYRLLELRYIEGQSPSDVMQALNISRSQYFRDQARILETLARTIYNRLPPCKQAAMLDDHAVQQQLLRREAERVLADASAEQVDVYTALEEVCAIIDPLVERRGARLTCDATEVAGAPRVDRVLFRQAILTLLTEALAVATGGCVRIETRAGKEVWEMAITAEGSPHASDAAPETASTHLAAGEQLAGQMGAAVETERGAEWVCLLRWPLREHRDTLLVVDDNEELAELFRRYLAGRDWRVVWAADAARAREVIRQACPTAITLDLLIPREDGWDLLTELRNDPRCSDIPVIVCSVLDQPDLALSLGARAYLAKPVTRQALLAALAPLETASAETGRAS